MKHVIRARFLVLIAVLLQVGCASVPPPRSTREAPRATPEAKRSQRDNSAWINYLLPMWIGHKASELIQDWGQPTEAKEATRGSYQNRGAYWISYHIGDTTPVMTLPEVSVSKDLSGNLRIYDSSTVVVPHFVNVQFVADASGRIIHCAWVGTFTDIFDVATHQPPHGPRVRGEHVFENYPPDKNGGNWTERTPEEAAKRITPTNILEKLKQNEPRPGAGN
jgi:hypothetical protein